MYSTRSRRPAVAFRHLTAAAVLAAAGLLAGCHQNMGSGGNDSAAMGNSGDGYAGVGRPAAGPVVPVIVIGRPSTQPARMPAYAAANQPATRPARLAAVPAAAPVPPPAVAANRPPSFASTSRPAVYVANGGPTGTPAVPSATVRPASPRVMTPAATAAIPPEPAGYVADADGLLIKQPPVPLGPPRRRGLFTEVESDGSVVYFPRTKRLVAALAAGPTPPPPGATRGLISETEPDGSVVYFPRTRQLITAAEGERPTEQPKRGLITETEPDGTVVYFPRTRELLTEQQDGRTVWFPRTRRLIQRIEAFRLNDVIVQVQPPRYYPVPLQPPPHTDPAMRYRHWSMAMAVIPGGSTRAGDTRFALEPAHDRGLLTRVVLDPALFMANTIFFPVTYLISPPFNERTYRGDLVTPSYTLNPPLPDLTAKPGPAPAQVGGSVENALTSIDVEAPVRSSDSLVPPSDRPVPLPSGQYPAQFNGNTNRPTPYAPAGPNLTGSSPAGQTISPGSGVVGNGGGTLGGSKAAPGTGDH